MAVMAFAMNLECEQTLIDAIDNKDLEDETVGKLIEDENEEIIVDENNDESEESDDEF